MDNSLGFVMGKHIDKTIKALEGNNMSAYFVNTRSDALQKAAGLIKDGDTVSCGGSMTLFETGIIDMLRVGDSGGGPGRNKYNFLDRYAKGLSGDDMQEIFRRSFYSDAYFTSSNAVTEDGELYNVDGNGNRVAAMIYGPKSVIVIVGINKLVTGREQAVERVKHIAAPANAARLNCPTPCAKTGECMDCSSGGRICCSEVFLGWQRVKGRIKVIIVGEQLGY